MAGGPSQVETFDPKPLLNKLHGQPRPQQFGEAKYQFIQSDAKLLGTKRTFRKYGKSGIEVSDLFPHTARCIDDIAVVRSMWTTDNDHGAQLQFHTGRHALELARQGLGVGAALASSWPQPPQNRSPGSLMNRQLLQGVDSSAPHCEQNRRPSRF